MSKVSPLANAETRKERYRLRRGSVSRSSSDSDSRSSSSSSTDSSTTSSSSSSDSDRNNRRRGGGRGGVSTARKSGSPSRSRSTHRSKVPRNSSSKSGFKGTTKERDPAPRKPNDSVASLKIDSRSPLLCLNRSPANTKRREISPNSNRKGSSSAPRRDCGSGNHSPPAKRRERSSTPKPVRVQVSGLTRSVTIEHVREIFSLFGVVKNVEFTTERYHPTLGRGIAYVEYSKSEECETAVKNMNAGWIDGQKITVSTVPNQKLRSPPVMQRVMGDGRGGWRSQPPFNRGFSNTVSGGRRSALSRRHTRR